MSVFIRRFTFDPGNEVLLEIESVNILDLDPPASIAGIGTGTVLCVGEFENGPFAAASGVREMPAATTEVAGATDFVNTFGSLGYTYAGINANNPSARQRAADSALVPEFWNGNGFVQLSGKKFKRLLIARVDTSVGAVEFRRQAFLVGAESFTYNLEPSQTSIVDVAGTTSTATFGAAAASRNGGAGSFPTGFVGGETLTIGYDDAPDFTVTFQSADQSQAQVIARINAAAGFAFATDIGGDATNLTGRVRGTQGRVRVISGSSGVLTALGFSSGTTNGTGSVGNIDAVTFQEVKSVIEAAISGVKVTRDSNGNLRIDMTYASGDDWMTYSASSTATALGFVLGQHVSNSGFAYVRSGSQTFATGFSGGETLLLGNDDQPNFTVTFLAGDQAQADVIARINQYAGYAMARTIDSTHMELRSNKNGGEVRVVAASAGGVLTTLGLTAPTTVDAVPLASGKIPAGTVVQKTDGTSKYVTMQDVAVTVAAIPGIAASGSGPYSVKIRPALDDGSQGSTNSGLLTALERAIDLGSFAVINPALVAAALSEAAIDAAYASAITATDDPNDVSHDCNVIFSSRQSNAVRKALRTNAIQASADGNFGRVCAIRPPLGTTRSQALSGSAEPGVGAYRDQRTIYCFPGANTFVPLIAQRGLAGGAGFTADGNVDVGADGFMASVLSQLPPEENPGQATSFMSAVNGLESSPNAQGFTIVDYTNFRSKGVAALRMDDGTAVFQSGVTSVDPSTNPQLRNIARRRMADFIQDTLARRCKAFGKKLATFVRRKALTNEIRNFLESLLSRANPQFQRIAGYTLDDKSGNTPETLAQGLYRIIIKVRTLASLDSIVLQTTIGESVTVDEILPQAA
jgi:hypothetical protein